MSESRTEAPLEAASPVALKGGPTPSMTEMGEFRPQSSLDTSLHMGDNNMEFRTAGSSILDDLSPSGQRFDESGFSSSFGDSRVGQGGNSGDLQSQGRSAIDYASQLGGAGGSALGQLEQGIQSLANEAQDIEGLIKNLIQEVQNAGLGGGQSGNLGQTGTPPESGIGGSGCGNISTPGNGSIGSSGGSGAPPESGIGGSGCGHISTPGNGSIGSGGGCGAITQIGNSGSGCGAITQIGNSGSGCGAITQIGNSGSGCGAITQIGNSGSGCGAIAQTGSGNTGSTGNPTDAIVQVIANDGPVAGGTALSEGTGFFVTSNGGIVTDAHVVQGSQGPIQIVLPNGQTVEAQVSKVDQADDLALLQVVGGQNGEFQTLPIASDSAASATDTAYGHPGGQSQLAQISGAFQGQEPFSNFSIANISSEDPGFNFNREGDLFNMNIQPGDSGAPILNSSGQVISVVDLGAAGGGCGGGCGAFGVGTPAQDIENLLA